MPKESAMIAVFVSSDNEKEDFRSLFSLLNRRYRVSVIDSCDTVIQKDTDILLLSLHNGSISAKCNCAAVLFSPSRYAALLPKHCTVLCFDGQAALYCGGKERQIISCGMHNKDTVTLSSLESGKPVLSLQRRLTAFSGNTIDVGDFPLIIDEHNRRALLAASVLLLLCGNSLSPDSFHDQSSTTVPPTLLKNPL